MRRALRMDRAVLREVGLPFAVPEPPRDAADARVHRQHLMVGREQQHPVRAALAHLRQALQRAACRGQRTPNHRRQIRAIGGTRRRRS